ncbi:hypothetical protein QGM71_21615 [Virgibacillus sp. C22-A2]|uniref:Uncharacterized protein n=1 Tax=Virgibacillus tibetensis TaxID=3042313 RepID=A0ABU6KL74_9BACI|nr:hypothetical protein [Virgibacillus sp. C22-A2]
MDDLSNSEVPGNGKIRRRINEAETREGLLDILYAYALELKAERQAS